MVAAGKIQYLIDAVPWDGTRHGKADSFVFFLGRWQTYFTGSSLTAQLFLSSADPWYRGSFTMAARTTLLTRWLLFFVPLYFFHSGLACSQ